jgi:shikimate dehydrogenase
MTMTAIPPLRFALLGFPLETSLSPTMHRAVYRALGLPHSYDLLPTRSEDLGLRVEELRRGVFHGFNVTMPHKRAVLEFVDREDLSVTRAGAANTLCMRDGEVWAYNTDGAALAAEIRELLTVPEQLVGKAALVLGSGGAARVAIAELVHTFSVKSVEIRARAFADTTEGCERARRFETELRSCIGAHVALSFSELVPAPHDAQLSCILQCTSDGMRRTLPAAANTPENGQTVADAIAWETLAKDVVALDIIYLPSETLFLRAARNAGARPKGGLGMLARQGAAACTHWLGCAPPNEVMLRALETELSR